MKKAILLLEDGTKFVGTSFASEGETFGEVVFNTSMTGYQEVLTDPSYKEQLVAMTYPLIGNYGINNEDIESHKIWVSAFIIKELSSITSNWRSSLSLGQYLVKNNIIGIEGIDTRKLTKHIRLAGAMKAVLSTKNYDTAILAAKLKSYPGLVGRDLVKLVTCQKPYWFNKNGKFRVLVLDCGVKLNILRLLAKNNCSVFVVPAFTSAKDIISSNPDGVLLSNGPGDPAAVTYAIETIKNIIERFPIFGICLGQQLLGHAFGGKTYKLKFGHHGANQPVMDLKTRKVAITSQNHGFCADIASLKNKNIEITHINLNDNTAEGMAHRKLPIFSVQYHPEASPGPHDSSHLFKHFVNLMKNNKK